MEKRFVLTITRAEGKINPASTRNTGVFMVQKIKSPVRNGAQSVTKWARKVTRQYKMNLSIDLKRERGGNYLLSKFITFLYVCLKQCFSTLRKPFAAVRQVL